MYRYYVGQRVKFIQHEHSVPVETERDSTNIPVHPVPASGNGVVCLATYIRGEWRLHVQDDDPKKREVLWLLRVPPDEALPEEIG